MKNNILNSQSGAAAVEFAIILWLLMTLIFGITEFSLIMYNKAVITNASREGARAGIVARWDPNTNLYNPLTDDDINTVVQNYCGNYVIDFNSPKSKCETVIPLLPLYSTRLENDSKPLDQKEVLEVTVRYDYHFLVLPNFVIGKLENPMRLKAVTRMKME